MIGAGDYQMTELTMVSDPCPLPNQEKKTQSLNKKDSLLYAPLSIVGAVSFDKDAVYIDIGRVNYTKKESLALTDQDGEQVLEESESDDDDAPASLLKNLQDVKSGVDEKMKSSSLRIFKSSKAVNAGDSESDSDSDSDEVGHSKRMSLVAIEELVKPFRNRTENDDDSSSNTESDDSLEESTDEESDSNESDSSDDSNDEVEDESESREGFSEDDDEDSEQEEDANRDGTSALWKTNLAQRAAEAYMGRELSFINLQELIYGKPTSAIISDEEDGPHDSDNDNESDSDDEFFKVRKPDAEKAADENSNSVSQSDAQLLGEDDSSRKVGDSSIDFDVSVWIEEGADSLMESIRNKFVTGNWDKNITPGDGNEEFGDFEDLETGEKFGPNGEIDSDDDLSVNMENTEGMTDEQIRELNAKRKASKKNNFDEEYDEEKMTKVTSATVNDDNVENEYIESLKRAKEARLQRNKEEFGQDGEATRIRHEGFRQGLYVRIRIDGVPCEFIENFKPEFPLILGGLTPQETNRGFIRCRFKKHRWHKKILKCKDPLIFSVGWRRFQSIPVFSTEDQNGRHRYVIILFCFLIPRHHSEIPLVRNLLLSCYYST
jgi:ribosome biogenesis protein BMS1